MIRRGRTLLVAATLLGALWPALSPSPVHAEGSLTAVQLSGACTTAQLIATGLTPGDRVILLAREVSEHTSAEVPSSSRIVGDSGRARWDLPVSALPTPGCEDERRFEFQVWQLRATGKLGRPVTERAELQTSPAPGVVGFGVEEADDSRPSGWAAEIAVVVGASVLVLAARGVVSARQRAAQGADVQNVPRDGQGARRGFARGVRSTLRSRR